MVPDKTQTPVNGYHFAARQAQNRKLEGGIQKVFQKALAAVAQHGDRVINASIGMALDDEGRLFTSRALMEELRAVSPEAVCSYAPIAGIPGYLKGTAQLFLGDDCQATPGDFPLYQIGETGFFGCPVATLGGSSALSLALNNFCERGARVLCGDYFWGPYETMTEARGLSLGLFRLFDRNGGFNHAAFAEGLTSIAGSSVLVLLNEPAHNPTGYCMTSQDWEAVCAALERECERRRVVLLLDIAYLGFHRSFEEDRGFIRRLLERPWSDNLLIAVAGSCSKAFLAYGVRIGTCIGLHRNPRVLREFFDCLEFNIRGEYSNIPRGAMTAVANICGSPEKMMRHREDIGRVRQALRDRSETWMVEAEAIGLRTVPYRAGYFLVVECERAAEVARLLEQDLVFAVPMEQGLRVAICSVPLPKIKGLASAIDRRIRAVR